MLDALPATTHPISGLRNWLSIMLTCKPWG